MKRVLFACLNQTIQFQLKDGLDHDLAVKQVQDEYQNYKKMLDRKHTKYKIMAEQVAEDGTITVQIKKQVNNYDLGNYLD